jgi:hypothetical protein
MYLKKLRSRSVIKRRQRCQVLKRELRLRHGGRVSRLHFNEIKEIEKWQE